MFVNLKFYLELEVALAERLTTRLLPSGYLGGVPIADEGALPGVPPVDVR